MPQTLVSDSRFRRTVILQLGVLFGVTTAVGGGAIVVLTAPQQNAGQTLAVVLAVVLVQTVLLGMGVGRIMRRTPAEPVALMVEDLQRIVDGDYGHRVRAPKSATLQQIAEGVNVMADRLIQDQEQLADNVASLEMTNRDLVEARNQVIQSARLASVGTLAAGIAHEVGNPLGAIVGLADVAKNRAQAKGDDPEIAEAIRGEAERIDRIVRGLLDYARPKSGDLRPTSPGVPIAKARELLETQGRLAQVEAIWQIDEGLPMVYLQEQHVEQILVNLLLNACHALEGRPNPTIEIRAGSELGPAAKMPARREGDHPSVNYLHRRRVAHDDDAEAIATLKTAHRIVFISVADNGPGLPEDALARVFDPFYTTKDPGKGTGLGLFISSKLTEGMGGRLEVRNRTEGGAEFVLRFPEAIGPPGADGSGDSSSASS